MAWDERNKFDLKVITVSMAVMCSGFLIWMASNVRRQIDSYNWPETPGVVERILAKRWRDDQNVTKYFGRVAYRYSVNDREYRSELTDLGPGWKRADRRAALADFAHYRPGDQVVVYYDPLEPGEGVIEKGIPKFQQVVLAGLAAGALVSISASTFMIWTWLFPSSSSAPAAEAKSFDGLSEVK